MIGNRRNVHSGRSNSRPNEGTLLVAECLLRAKWIAENFLNDAKCYSTVRNMFGFTGTYRGVPVSVQGTGMGMPSAAD
jgi:purine-nucleoside phosphorylase